VWHNPVLKCGLVINHLISTAHQSNFRPTGGEQIGYVVLSNGFELNVFRDVLRHVGLTHDACLQRPYDIPEWRTFCIENDWFQVSNSIPGYFPKLVNYAISSAVSRSTKIRCIFDRLHIRFGFQLFATRNSNA
jgi:hypothetical protein